MANLIIPYTTPGNYTYDSDKIEIADGLAKLKEDLSNVYACWHLNESSGINVPDDSGNGRNGTCINMEDADWVAGKLNNCLNFDGVNEYVNCGDIAGFERNEPFSFEAWIGTSDDLAQIIISKMESYKGWMFYITVDGTLGAVLANAADNRLLIESSLIVDDGSWHHVIMTYNGSSNANGINFYVDGSLDTNVTIVYNDLSDTILNSDSCKIASRYAASPLPFNGLIDEVVIYDKELSQAEATYRYNSASGRENWPYYSDKPTIEPTVLFDPATVVFWDSFLETLGGGNQGSIGYNLYKVDKANKYYWNGSAWVTGGSFSNYNIAAIVNTNIPTFDATPDIIGLIAYLISDGTQIIELDENQIGYTENQAPLVNAGIDKSVYDNQNITPFSDCSFSDPDGTIDFARYKIDGEVDVWTNIPQGAYGSLLEAVQAFQYQFDNPGILTVRLQVEDNEGATSEDDLQMTVQKYTVTFNVKDNQGNHLASFMFNAGDGSGWQEKNSPFIHDYDYSATDLTASFDKEGYAINTITVPTTVHTENVTLSPMLQNEINRILGLVQENFRIDNTVYISGLLSTGRIRIFPSAADVDAGTNAIAEYSITAVYDANDLIIDYKVKKT